MLKLTLVPVIPLALSEAMKTATLAISASVISRRGWVLLARISPSDVVGCQLKRFAMSALA